MPEGDSVDDEWQVVNKTTRRRRPQRRRGPNYFRDGVAQYHGRSSSSSNNNKAKDASRFLENARSAQLKIMIDVGASVAPGEIEATLESCLAELKESRYWDTVRLVLESRAEKHGYRYGSIVCYGIGNFGTKRPSAPMWQLALALMIRDHIGTAAATNATANSSGPRQRSESQTPNKDRGPESKTEETATREKRATMHYFEPLMTVQESKVLEKLGIHVIKENERGKRSVNDEDGNGGAATVFFMPHCPMSLYTNLFHSNWDSLRQIIVFGNSLSNYIDGGNAQLVSDPKKKQALEMLEVLQPFWEVDRLGMDKKDISDRSAYFEQAFNDSSFTSFATITRDGTSTAEEANRWPERPQLDSSHDEYDDGEVI